MNRKTPLALLGALFAIVTAPAQTAPAGAAQSETGKEEAVLLKEFRVDTSKDRGYLATNATTGTRLNMASKDIPLPIEVITREFIDDIGAVDVKESLRYSAGIVQDTVTTSNSFTFSPSGSGNAGSVNRNSDTAYNDQTRGIDMQVYFNLTEHLSTVLTYQYLTQGVTGGFRVVDQPKSTEYDSWWNYMGVPLETRRANLDESSYDFSGQTKGRRTLDNPRNQLSIWNKYDFTEGVLKGVDLGLGAQFNGQR